MEKIPTAKEFANEIRMPRGVSYQSEIGELMIEFAKLHVQAALQAAADNAEIKEVPYTGCMECGRRDTVVNGKSILNAYSLENIK